MANLELTEKVLTAINTGRTADFVHSHTKKIFDDKVAQILAKIKADYRAGKFDANAVQSQVATLCALEDIENALKRQIAQGDKALKDSQGNGD